jgi:predicted membrane protein
MTKRPSPIEWDIVTFAFAGALLGVFVGGVFCCYQMAVHGADSHIVKDSAIGGLVGTLVLGTLSMIRNQIMRIRDFR